MLHMVIATASFGKPDKVIIPRSLFDRLMADSAELAALKGEPKPTLEEENGED